MNSIIYQITNKIDNKSYIGFTIRETERIDEHKKPGDSPYLYNAIKKYGWENFTYKVLYRGKDPNHTLKIKEPYFIKKYNTKFPNGYNLTNGGEGTIGYHHTEKTKKKISKNTKLGMTTKIKNKLSAWHKKKFYLKLIEKILV